MSDVNDLTTLARMGNGEWGTGNDRSGLRIYEFGMRINEREARIKEIQRAGEIVSVPAMG